MKNMGERLEALIRIVVGVISGIILSLWMVIVRIATFIHWIYVIFNGKRSKGLAEFCNLWNTQIYRFIRYMTFTTNERPFPFTTLGNVRDEVVLKKEKTKDK